MKVDFYFDPSCPFSWITSRWLLVVSGEAKDLEINWQPFSLAIKNDELIEKEDDNQYTVSHRQSLRVLRVMLAANRLHGTDFIEAYSAFGFEKHIMFEEFTDEIISKTLTKLELPSDLIEQADITKYDSELQGYIDKAIDIVGSDIGVPTMVFTLSDGSQQGYFGPVLQSLPSKEDSLKIWEGVSRLATVKDFYELKRNRPDGQPDTPSTARC